MKFRVNDCVFHRVFGSGVVVAVCAGAYVVKFDRLETNRNIRDDFPGMWKSEVRAA